MSITVYSTGTFIIGVCALICTKLGTIPKKYVYLGNTPHRSHGDKGPDRKNRPVEGHGTFA